MKRIFLISITLLVAFNVFVADLIAATKAKREVKKGNLLYNRGEFENALKEYEEALLKSPDSDVVNFNLGTALYKTKDYKAAERHFEKALVTEDESLEGAANYNLGNAEYKYGISKENENIEEAISLLKRALGHYENAILLDEEDEDAKYNYEFVKKELERLLKKKEEQKKKEKKEDKKDSRDKPEEKEGQQDKKEKEEKEKDKEKGDQKKEEPDQEKKEEKPETKEESAAGGKRPYPQDQKPGEMSGEEASMMLEGYQDEEEPKGLYKEKMTSGGLSEVLKDW